MKKTPLGVFFSLHTVFDYNDTADADHPGHHAQ